MGVNLRVYRSGKLWADYVLDGCGEYLIGSSPHCCLRLPDAKGSEEHCRIIVDDSAVTLRNGSMNPAGTMADGCVIRDDYPKYLNGETKNREIPLQDGSVILAGLLRIQVSIHPDPAAGNPEKGAARLQPLHLRLPALESKVIFARHSSDIPGGVARTWVYPCRVSGLHERGARIMIKDLREETFESMCRHGHELSAVFSIARPDRPEHLRVRGRIVWESFPEAHASLFRFDVCFAEAAPETVQEIRALQSHLLFNEVPRRNNGPGGRASRGTVSGAV